jgi:erythromycin esterase
MMGALTRLLKTVFGAIVLAVAMLGIPSCESSPTPPGQSTPTHADVLAGASAWLHGAALPFDRVDPADNLDDLEPLRSLVGDARIVSLGEATHGTREFFRMKHRILRFLVERMGFTAFAIEATWPEANRLDRYVRSGEGDPAVLLSGLYFWTWNTDEVLQMIQWMRRHNESGGSVGFYGFDMQYPGMAIDNVARFVASVDRGASAEFAQRYECLARYANDATGRSPSPGYGDQAAAYRDACLQDLRWVQDTLTSRRASYEPASSPVEWARAVQSARVAVQYEEMSSKRRSRDLAMADNAKWILDQLPTGGKIVLWAHNGHVSSSSNATMGGALRQMLGQAMVVMGFSFAQGTFNAVGMSGSAYTPLGPHTVGGPKYDSYEEYFFAGRMPRFFLDLRNRSTTPGTPSWLLGPRNALSIGAVYSDTTPDSYYYLARLPAEYDVVIFLDQTTPSVLLPFSYPRSF